MGFNKNLLTPPNVEEMSPLCQLASNIGDKQSPWHP